jgi:hypothetical protein
MSTSTTLFTKRKNKQKSKVTSGWDGGCGSGERALTTDYSFKIFYPQLVWVWDDVIHGCMTHGKVVRSIANLLTQRNITTNRVHTIPFNPLEINTNNNVDYTNTKFNDTTLNSHGEITILLEGTDSKTSIDGLKASNPLPLHISYKVNNQIIQKALIAQSGIVYHNWDHGNSNQDTATRVDEFTSSDGLGLYRGVYDKQNKPTGINSSYTINGNNIERTVKKKDGSKIASSTTFVLGGGGVVGLKPEDISDMNKDGFNHGIFINLNK